MDTTSCSIYNSTIAIDKLHRKKTNQQMNGKKNTVVIWVFFFFNASSILQRTLKSASLNRPVDINWWLSMHIIKKTGFWCLCQWRFPWHIMQTLDTDDKITNGDIVFRFEQSFGDNLILLLVSLTVSGFFFLNRLHDKNFRILIVW